MADEGATPRELVLEACRRNNTDLLEEVISSTRPTQKEQTREEAVASLLNETRDGMGNAALHIAASAGSYEVLDVLLDQPGLETDPLDRMYNETPLHKAVALCNSFPVSSSSNTTSSAANASVDDFLVQNEGHAIVEILIDAGCDPRIRNKSKVKPGEMVDGRNMALKDFLKRAELLLIEGAGIVDEDGAVDEADDEAKSGSGSETD